jgi:hypothetical protein
MRIYCWLAESLGHDEVSGTSGAVVDLIHYGLFPASMIFSSFSSIKTLQ